MNDNKKKSCPTCHCIKLIGATHKATIILKISEGVNRFGALSREVGGITKQTLAKRLKDLEADRLVHKEVHSNMPLRVDYSLTERGHSVLEIIHMMYDWGKADLDKLQRR